MEQKPSLSQYFGGADPPPASQFFDEIGSTPADMIQSIYLGEPEAQEKTANITTNNMAVSFSQQQPIVDQSFSNLLPTISGSTITAANLPDPSTFFDNIASDAVGSVMGSDDLSQAMDGLSVSNQHVDKDADRRRDAWIPSEEAHKTLIKAQSSPKGAFFPDRDVLTMPGLILEEELVDSLQDAAVKHLGIGAWGNRSAMRADHVSRDEAGLRELLRTGYLSSSELAISLVDSLQDAAVKHLGIGAWGNRSAMRADHVSRDEAGLRELLRTGYLRAAANLTGNLLDACAQGVGKLNRPSKHTPRTLQIWLTRFAILARIKLYDILAKEAQAFGDFGKPDMYYQFNPDTFGDRSGSLVPFALRLIVAEAPAYVGKQDEAIDRLYAIYAVIQKMLSNLRAGKTEDGTSPLVSDSDRTESIRLWTGRQTRVLHSIINCAIAVKDYRLAINLLKALAAAPELAAQQKRSLTSALCRLSLQAGHVSAASRYLQETSTYRQTICPTPDVREYIDMGLVEIAQGHHQEAYNHFVKAADQEPTNIMVANNLSVCLLYMGKLKDAISVLEKALNSDPERGLNESLLLNLCTLYELECSNPKEKKLSLLRMLCKYKSDSLPNVLECLKLNA